MFFPPHTTSEAQEPSIRCLSGPAITTCHFPFPRDTGGLTSRGHWELEWRGSGYLELGRVVVRHAVSVQAAPAAPHCVRAAYQP